VAVVAEVLGWTPLGAPYTVGLEVAAGRLWAVPLKLLIVLLALGGLLRWWAATLERAMLGTASAARGGAGARAGTPVELLLLRGLPRSRFGALVARETRYWWRETRRRTSLIMVVVVGVFVPLPLAVTGAEMGGLSLMIGVLGAVGLANQFGYDGSAYAANVTAGVPGRLEIHSRAAAQAIYLLPVLLVTAVVLGTLSGEPGSIASRLGVLVATYGVGLGLVLPVSVRAAYALPESTSPFALSSGGGLAKGLPVLGVLVGTLIAVVPLHILGYTLGGVWPWIGLPVGLAYGAAGYLIGSGVAGDMLDRRMPEVLAAVASGR
ncbi:MAG TPA: ABC transporter permease, partial [Actinoplanes sp.]